jgi:hypothetical protein
LFFIVSKWTPLFLSSSDFISFSVSILLIIVCHGRKVRRRGERGNKERLYYSWNLFGFSFSSQREDHPSSK